MSVDGQGTRTVLALLFTLMFLALDSAIWVQVLRATGEDKVNKQMGAVTFLVVTAVCAAVFVQDLIA